MEHTQRRGDIESPGPPAAQDHAGDLSAPIPQRISEPAVMSAIDVRISVLPTLPAPAVTPASAEIPAAAAIPDSSETPASAENPILRTMAPPQQYVQTGERAPKLSAVPSRQEVVRVMEVLLSNGTPFTPTDVVHASNKQSFTTLFKRKFATDPDRRDACKNWQHWTNQYFCRELNITVPTSAVNHTNKLSFIGTISQVALQFDLKNKSVEDKTDQLLADIVEAFPDETPALQFQATKILIDNLPVETINWRAVLQRSLNNTTPRLITIEDFRFVWLAQLAKLRESIDALRFIDVSPLYGDRSRQMKPPPPSSLDKIKKRPREDEQSVQSEKSD